MGIKIRPLHDRVVVKRSEEQRTSPGGIVLPDPEKPAKGVVVSTGNGKLLSSGKVRPLAVQPGDQVLFGKYAGTEVSVDNEVVLVMREDEITAVVN